MKEYLNKQMEHNKGFNSDDAQEFKVGFPRAVATVIEGLGNRPFRPRRVVNAAILEAVFITILENPSVSPTQLSERYSDLLRGCC
jgi:hypothetical protein